MCNNNKSGNRRQIERKRNAWAISQGHDGSGLGENIAVIEEEVPQGMCRSTDLQRSRTGFKNYVKFNNTKKTENHLCVGCAERKEKV